MSAYYDPPANATRPYVVIVCGTASTNTNTAVTTAIDIVRNASLIVAEPRGNYDLEIFDDEVFHFPSAALRPRKGAYVALLPPPHLAPRPSLEASPRSAPREVRQAGWRLAVHTRHVTTSL